MTLRPCPFADIGERLKNGAVAASLMLTASAMFGKCADKPSPRRFALKL